LSREACRSTRALLWRYRRHIVRERSRVDWLVAKPEAAVIKPEQCVFESTGVGPQHRDKPCAKTHQPPFKFGDPHIRHCTKKPYSTQDATAMLGRLPCQETAMTRSTIVCSENRHPFQKKLIDREGRRGDRRDTLSKVEGQLGVSMNERRRVWQYLRPTSCGADSSASADFTHTLLTPPQLTTREAGCRWPMASENSSNSVVEIAARE
jgi:hypothetical protein